MMQNHCHVALLPPHDCNPTTQLWEKFSSSVVLNDQILDWFNFVQLCMVMVLGSVEDEHTFSNLSFMKKKLQNCLKTHLNLVVRTYAQTFYTLEAFPFFMAMCEWNEHWT